MRGVSAHHSLRQGLCPAWGPGQAPLALPTVSGAPGRGALCFALPPAPEPSWEVSSAEPSWEVSSAVVLRFHPQYLAQGRAPCPCGLRSPRLVSAVALGLRRSSGTDWALRSTCLWHAACTHCSLRAPGGGPAHHLLRSHFFSMKATVATVGSPLEARCIPSRLQLTGKCEAMQEVEPVLPGRVCF